MSVKSLSSLFSFSKSSSFSSCPSSAQTFPESMVEENIENVETLITKWELSSSSDTKVSSLFLHNRKEAKELLKSVKDLRQAMHFLLSENSTSNKLVHAQNLMQIAMKSLEHQFYQTLSKNRDHLDLESVLSVSGQSSDGLSSLDGMEASEDEDELKRAGETITEMEGVSQFPVSDLKAIAECMVSCGYGKECTKIYTLVRRSVVDEKLYQLGIERLKASQIQKMNWEALEHMIKNWLSAVKIAVKTLFTGEKVVCDHVFSASTATRESCFSDITKEGAMNLFRFPELIAKGKKSPERIFRMMELYEALSEIWPEVESIFNIESTSAIKLQALSSRNKLADSIRVVLSNFESTMQKDLSKTPTVGGGIHPLTRSAMSYISSLGDYSQILSDIIADYPPPSRSTFPESYFASPTSGDHQTSAVSVHLAWLLLVLFCKLDSKAQLYKDVSLTYLFLVNNLHFVVERVHTSQLKDLLGDEWVFRHDKKIKQYALNYETMAWTKVFSSLPEKNSSEMSPEAAKECFRRFNAAFEEAYMKQTSRVIPNAKLRDELKVSIAKKLVPAYREFYDAYSVMLGGEKSLEVLARFGPKDLGNYLSDLFPGTPILSSSSSSSSLSSLCSSESQGSITH
ncbi:hypothetical protein JRO89_XS14G0051100 [Xanthoceras sorbifolium]|uniref:Exocyst subunit Exo70 family protein n=1 Tax=Xanthoceras sorbifolium TaxID=99658 RepID=A0ABQ8H3U5_9ROSI|nr:hypothetical protein JRO89_XS14G0051100 [Xanthoceras sorbifolium]